MSDLARLPSHDERAQAAWAAYVAARERAEASHSFADGRPAGRAWSDFLRLYEPRAEGVVPLRRLAPAEVRSAR